MLKNNISLKNLVGEKVDLKNLFETLEKSSPVITKTFKIEGLDDNCFIYKNGDDYLLGKKYLETMSQRLYNSYISKDLYKTNNEYTIKEPILVKVDLNEYFDKVYKNIQASKSLKLNNGDVICCYSKGEEVKVEISSNHQTKDLKSLSELNIYKSKDGKYYDEKEIDEFVEKLEEFSENFEPQEDNVDDDFDDYEQ